MTWAKLDDQFFLHPKVIDRSKDAKLLFLAGLTYCAGQLTDGLISPASLRMIAAQVDVPREVADELLAAGLWEMVEGGYHVHDYLNYNPTGDEVRARREARAEAGRKGGLHSGETRAQKAIIKREANEAKREANASANAQAKREAKAKQNRTPSPYPYPEEELSSSKVISGIFAADVATSGADAPSQPVTDTDMVTPPTAKRHAPINPLWDALVAVFGYEPRSTGERSKWGKIVKHLKDAKATPEDVRRAKANYDAGVASGVYRWSLTPNALDNHLGELLSGAPRAPTPSQPRGYQPVGAAAAAMASRPIRTVDDAVPEGY